MSARAYTHVLIAALAGVVMLAATAQAQTTWYVDDDAPDDPGPGDPGISDPLEDGSSEHPFDAIQEAIDVTVDGDTVLVAEGTYTGPGNRDIDFHGKLITVSSVDGPIECQIDCGGEGIGFYFHSGETADAVLEGFRIINAHVTGPQSGAVVCDEASPAITECRIWTSDGPGLFCKNAAPIITECSIKYSAGAGVFCNNADPTLFDCHIWHNSAEGVKSVNSDPVLTWCSIDRNANSGIFCDRGSLEITSCGVTENAAFGVYCYDAGLLMTSSTVSENGYGGIYCDGGSSTIDGCSINENLYVGGAGGGIAVTGGDATILGCTISRNAGDLWGGIWFDTGDLAVSDCTITRNIALHPAGFAAGISGGGADATIRNCTIAMNLGGCFGGGITLIEARATVCNSVVARNDSTGRGGGIYCEWAGDVALINSTIVENTSGNDGSALYCWGSIATLVNNIVRDNWDPDGLPFVVDEWETPTLLAVSYCNIEDSEAAVYVYDDAALSWGSGNIDADPLFTDPGESDYRLDPGSPCIDAGCNWSVPLNTTDLDGEGRFFDDPNTADTGCGNAPIVDMGSYEFGGTGPQPCLGDLDDDRDVDFADLNMLLAVYGDSGTCAGDLDCDGDVDLTDLAEMIGAYGTTCD